MILVILVFAEVWAVRGGIKKGVPMVYFYHACLMDLVLTIGFMYSLVKS